MLSHSKTSYKLQYCFPFLHTIFAVPDLLKTTALSVAGFPPAICPADAPAVKKTTGRICTIDYFTAGGKRQFSDHFPRGKWSSPYF